MIINQPIQTENLSQRMGTAKTIGQNFYYKYSVSQCVQNDQRSDIVSYVFNNRFSEFSQDEFNCQILSR